MAKIKLHNPELAANSTFGNLVLESLTVDPTVTGVQNAGRIWFNTTEKRLKSTILNAGGTGLDFRYLVDNTDIENLNTSLAADLATEIAARQAGDTALDTRVTAVEGQVNGKIGDLEDLTTDAKDTIVEAVNEINADLATEVAAREAGDTALDTKVTALDTRVTTVEGQVNGKIGDLSSLTTTEKGTIVDAVNELDADLATEVAAREDAITAVETDVETNYLNKTTTDAQTVAADVTFGGSVEITGETTIADTLSVMDVATFTNNVVIKGDLVISGTQTIVETEVLKIADNIITLNAGIGAETEPTENAGLEVDRGVEGITQIIQWDELVDAVKVYDSATDALVKVATVNDITSATGDLSDSLDAEIARATAAELALANDLSAETTRATAAETTLTTALAAETTARESADTALDTRVTTVEGQVNGKIGDLVDLTTDAKDTIVAAVNEIDAALAAETTARESADTALDTRVTAVEGQVNGNIGDLTELTTDAKTDLVSAINEIDAELAQEVSDREAADTALDTRVTAVEGQVNGNIGDLTELTTATKTDLVSAINEIDAEIAAETTRATDAETALETRIDNVNTAAGITGDVYTAKADANYIATATSLVDADNKLDATIKTNVDDLADTTAGKGTALVGYKGYTEADITIVNPTIKLTAGTLEEAIDDIAASVNSKMNEFENRYVKGEVPLSDISDSYTLAHNLDTTFVNVSIQVYDADASVWRFDLVIVEVLDANSIKVSLSAGTASQIKYVIQGF